MASEDDIFLSLDPSGATPLLDNDASLSNSNVKYVFSELSASEY